MSQVRGLHENNDLKNGDSRACLGTRALGSLDTISLNANIANATKHLPFTTELRRIFLLTGKNDFISDTEFYKMY